VNAFGQLFDAYPRLRLANHKGDLPALVPDESQGETVPAPQKIAEKIGYSHAAIYQHFPDKAHILSELCEETFALLADDFDKIAAGCPDPRQRLFETSLGLVRLFLAHPHHVRVVFFGPADRNGVRLGEYIDNIRQPLFARLARVLSEAIKANNLKPGPDRLTADAWWGAVLGLALALTIQGGLPGFSPADEVMLQLVTTMWSGIAGMSHKNHQLRKTRKTSAKPSKR
jgi:AcrR family transcriptional regulator